MGVRGLTTYIANNADKYLEHYELHDTYLVIDGNNIASHLYKWHCKRNDCFGGDYDKYAKIVRTFFKLLEDCNITPLIILDGGYEDKKMKTVYSRLKNKIRVGKQLNSVTQGSAMLFPLFLRDLFVEIVLSLQLKVVRCDFEADFEMACLARSLNCPVLSYDSDFYVFDVLYIPFSTFEMNVRKRQNSLQPSFYIDCQLYRIEKFLKGYGGLSKENLPLIATLLGNDYINKSVFRNFYSHIKLPKRQHMQSEQQRKIVSILKWMQNETYDSAVKKILGRLKSHLRKRVAEKIQTVTEGYVCKTSKFLQYLNIELQEDERKSEFNFNITELLDQVEELEDIDDADNCSISSESESETSESSLLAEEVENKSDEHLNELPNKDISNLFIENYRKCLYPAQFMDIVTRNKYFCTPQIENYSNPCSHHISAVILSVIHKILTSGNVETLTYVARGEGVRIQNYTTPVCKKELPTVLQLRDVHHESAKDILLDVLDINSKFILDFLNNLPPTWHLYVLAIIYWIKNTKPQVTYSHVYSVVLCMLVLNKIDKKIGYYRSSKTFFNKFKPEVTKLNLNKEHKSLNNDKSSFMEMLDNITHSDCILSMKELIKYFQMEEKMMSRVKLFDIQIIDCFAQFQSCLLHISYLNKLLTKPYIEFLISDFYDGTFLYNMCVNLQKRNNVDAYLSVLLQDSESILDCYKILVEMLTNILAANIIPAGEGKRKRRKKKKNVVCDIEEAVCKETNDSNDESMVDVNNRFSLLNLVK